MGGGGSPTGWYAPSSMNTGGYDPYANQNFPLHSGGYGDNAGNLWNRQGQRTWSPGNPGQSYSTGNNASGIGVDTFGNPVMTSITRRNTP
jgi:hypothetical protein